MAYNRRTTVHVALQDWKKEVCESQQALYNTLGDRVWDIVDDENRLEQKIRFALNCVSIIDNNTEEINCVNNIKTHIINLWNDITKKSNSGSTTKFYFASVFVFHLKDNVVKQKSNDGVDVLFRIPEILNDKLNSYIFIDKTCLTYYGWDDYLRYNTSPKYCMCYPLNGVYTGCNGIVNIKFKEWVGMNSTSTTGFSFSSLTAPVVAPFVWDATTTIVASGAYDLPRQVYKSTDVKNYHTYYGFTIADLRDAWISLASTGASGVSVGGTALSHDVFASDKKVISQNKEITLRVMNLSSVVVSGVDVLNSLIAAVKKFINCELDKKDLLKFTEACFFFLNAIVSLDIADQLIKDVASSDITYLFCTTTNSMYNFTKPVSIFTESSAYDELKALIFGQNSQLMPSIDLNYIGETIPVVFSRIDELSKGEIYWETFTKDVSEIFDNILFKQKKVICKFIKKLAEDYKINWKSYVIKSGGKPFSNSSPDIVRKFCMIINQTVSHCNVNKISSEVVKDILSLVDDKLYPCNYSLDFLNLTKFICDKFIVKFDDIKKQHEYIGGYYKIKRSDEQKLDSDYENKDGGYYKIKSSDEQKLDSDYENKERNSDYYRLTLEKFKSKEGLKSLYNSYFDLMKNYGYWNSHNPCMETNLSIHYTFFGPPGQLFDQLTDQEICKTVNNITDCNLNEKNLEIISSDGIVLIYPVDKSNNVKAVILYSTGEMDCNVGMITLLKNNSTES